MRISSGRACGSSPRLVLELGVEELGHEVVGRVLGPPVDVVGEQLGAAQAPGRRRHLVVVVVEAQALVDPVADRHLVLLGDAEQHADREHRHDRAEVGDEVEAPVVRPAGRGCGRRTRAPSARSRSSPSGVNTRDSRPRCRSWIGRVLHQDQARRDVEAGHDRLERRSLPRPVGVPVDEAPSRRRRSGSARRSRTSRCGRAAPRRASASTTGADPCRSRC